MRHKIPIAIVLLVIVGALLAIAVVGVFIPTEPEAWTRVHIGMNRTEVIALVGTPQHSGWPEMVIETWERKGFVFQRRLNVVYQGEWVEKAWMGTWLRGYGWLHPPRESR